MHIEIRWCNPEERYYFKYIGVDGRIILKLILRRQDERVWTGLIRLRIGTSDVLL
jgi:hypothetical protein